VVFDNRDACAVESIEGVDDPAPAPFAVLSAEELRALDAILAKLSAG
jgi:hypothetical protein